MSLKKGKKENKAYFRKMKKELFPFSAKKIDKNFTLFLLKVLFSILCLFFSLFLYPYIHRENLGSIQLLFNILYRFLLSLDILIIINFLYNVLRYTQFLFHIFKKNPLLNEKINTLLLAGINNQIVELKEEPEFYKKQKNFLNNWKTLFELFKSLTLFFPRLLFLAFAILFFHIKSKL